MQRYIKTILLLGLLVLLPLQAWGTVHHYYIDPNAADDTGAGTSLATAKKTGWGCLMQIALDFAASTSKRAYIHISEGTLTFSGTTAFVMGPTGSNLYGVGATYGLAADGTAAEPWIIEGAGMDKTILDGTGAIYKTYMAMIGSNRPYTYVRNLTIQNNDETHDDILFSGANNCRVENCKLLYRDHAVWFLGAKDGYLGRSWIQGQWSADQSSAVKYSDKGHTLGTAVVEDCIIYNSGGTGTNYHFAVEATNASYVTVRNNTIYGSKFLAVGAISGSTNFVLQNNLISDASQYNVFIDGTSQTGFLADNNLYNTSGATPFYWGGSFGTAKQGPKDGTTYSLADWKTNTGKDANSISADPYFVDATGGDFHLSSSSPAIGAGSRADVPRNSTGANLDYFGVTRFQMPYDRMNIGADQAGSGAALRPVGVGTIMRNSTIN